MTGRVALVVATVAVVGALAVAQFDTSTATTFARTEHLAEQIRCPVCDGVSVAGSPSDTARAIWDDIADRVDRGESDEQIIGVYVDRYGDWILLTPGSRGARVVLGLPLLVIVAALVALRLRRRALGPGVEGPMEERS